MSNTGTRRHLHNRKIIMMIVAAVIIAAVIIIVSITGKTVPQADTSAGLAYLRIMGERDPAETERRFLEASRQKQLEQMRLQVEEDPDMVWKYLRDENTVIMGDSRVMGFYAFEYMDESHILAEGGATIHEIWDYTDALAALAPNLLVLSFGLNDVNTYWLYDTVEDYIAELNEIMAYLTELLPNCYIYVQSIIPADEVGLELSPTWGVIPEWNERIRENCAQMGWRYLDITDVVYENWDAYELDGVHLQYFFYPPWARAIWLRYLDDSMGE